MARVFLSYAREDARRLRALAAAIERAGHELWWDEHIPGGDQFGEVIETQLARADVVVAVWSAASVKSAWVRDEASTGRDSGRLVPVSLDGSMPPLGFRQFHTIDLSKWNGRAASRHLEPLIKAIGERAGVKPADRSPEQPAPGDRRWSSKARVAVAAGVVAVAGAAALAWGLLPGPASAAVTPTVELGQFTLASTDVPRGLTQALNNEILAAFGTEHELSLVTGGGSGQFVLGGSIQKSTDSLRFTVNLTNRRTGGLIWSHAFDRALQDSLAPRQVAIAATQVVRCGIWGASSYRKPLTDQALALYVDWCNAYWSGSEDEERILDSARRVSAALPDFSYAWSALALSAVPIAHRGDDSEARDVADEGMKAANKAISLNRLNPEGYMAQAGLLATDRFAEREQLLEKAIKARPTECGCERLSYGDFLTSVGRNDEAVGEFDRARAMMPLAPMTNVRLAQALYLVGRSREADEVVARMLEAWPDSEIVRVLQLKTALWTGRFAQARSALESGGLHLADAERQALASAFAALESRDPAARAIAASQLQGLAADSRANDRLVVAALAALDQHAAALAAADALIRERGPALADVLFDPNLARAAGSPQFAAIVERLGLARYWRSTRRRPDLCGKLPNANFCMEGGEG